MCDLMRIALQALEKNSKNIEIAAQVIIVSYSYYRSAVSGT